MSTVRGTVQLVPRWKKLNEKNRVAWWAAWVGCTVDDSDFTIFLLIMVPIKVRRLVIRRRRGVHRRCGCAVGAHPHRAGFLIGWAGRPPMISIPSGFLGSGGSIAGSARTSPSSSALDWHRHGRRPRRITWEGSAVRCPFARLHKWCGGGLLGQRLAPSARILRAINDTIGWRGMPWVGVLRAGPWRGSEDVEELPVPSANRNTEREQQREEAAATVGDLQPWHAGNSSVSNAADVRCSTTDDFDLGTVRDGTAGATSCMGSMMVGLAMVVANLLGFIAMAFGAGRQAPGSLVVDDHPGRRWAIHHAEPSPQDLSLWILLDFLQQARSLRTGTATRPSLRSSASRWKRGRPLSAVHLSPGSHLRGVVAPRSPTLAVDDHLGFVIPMLIGDHVSA